MTTQPPNAQDIQTNTRNVTAAPVTPLHEAVIKMVNDLIAQQMQQYGITFGNVTGQDGGAVRVLIDGEDDPRQVGFPRAVGVQYTSGARVALGTTTTGDKFILGPVNDGTGTAAEAVVGTPNTVNQNVAQNSIDGSHIRGSAVDTPQLADGGVTNGKLAGQAVDTPQLRDNSVTNAKINGGAVDTAQLNNGAVTAAKIANGVVGTTQLTTGVKNSLNNADNAVQPNQLSNYVLVSDYDAMQRILSGAVLTVNNNRVTLPTFNRL